MVESPARLEEAKRGPSLESAESDTVLTSPESLMPYLTFLKERSQSGKILVI